MKTWGGPAAALMAAIAVGTAACGSGPPAAKGTAPSSSSTGGSPSSSGSETTPTGPKSTSATTAINLAVTETVRAQLVAAGAALNGIPVAQYSGLTPGLTYYALDQATGTYWAAAQLSPAPSSNPNQPTQAQVASQDDGSYYLFTMASQGGTWKVYADGNTGPNTPCPVTVPADVLQVWGWAPGSCRPADT